MPFSAGRRLGPYEILAPLGAGGMGEVYRARDTRLGREVAVKVMPAELAADAGRRARFEQEARAVAALNHPGIVAVHDIGSSEDGLLYMVTELVDGVTLRQALSNSGPMTPRKAVELGAEIADALAAAHARGITHRDLKPDNIMLTREGRAKVLDFGLAKNTGAKLGAQDATLTAMAMMGTDPGTVMGTVGYMSPEQVRGVEADARSDIFSFGAVLHEMLSGKRAFAKESAAETMTAIAREDVAELPESIPSGLRQVTRHCLEKEPGQRFQSMKDLAFGLRTMGLSTNSSQTLPAAPEPRRRRRQWPVMAAIGVSCLAAGLLLAPREEITGRNLKVTRVSQEDGSEGTPEFSPDGKSIAYISRKGLESRLMVRTLETGQTTVLASIVTRSGFPTCIFWSTDGGRIYFENKGGLWEVGVAGGPASVVLPGDRLAESMPGGKGILVGRREPDRLAFWVSDPAGSEPRRVKDIPFTDGTPVSMNFSPDGKKLALINLGVKLTIVQWPSGEYRDFPVDPRSIGWLPDSRHLLLMASQRNMSILDTVSGSERVIHAGDFLNAAISPDARRIAFSHGRLGQAVLEYSSEGKFIRVLAAGPRRLHSPRWTPDGRSVVYVDSLSPEFMTVAVRDEVSGNTRHLNRIESTGLIVPLEVSPDGKRVAYVSAGKLWTVSMSGGLPFAISDQSFARFAWSPDGGSIVFQTSKGLYKVPSQGGATPVELYKPAVPGRNGGVVWVRNLIYFSDMARVSRIPEGGGSASEVGAFPGSLLSAATSDGSQLQLLEERDAGSRVLMVDAKTGALVKAVTIETDGTVRAFSMHPDRKRLAVWVQSPNSVISLLEGFPRPAVGLERLWRKWVESN